MNQLLSRHPPRAQYRRRGRTGCMIPITVEATLADSVRHMLFSRLGDCVKSLRVEPLSCSRHVRIWLRLNRSDVHVVMVAIMRVLPAAEFGRVHALENARMNTFKEHSYKRQPAEALRSTGAASASAAGRAAHD